MNKTEQHIKLMAEMQMLFAKMFSMEMSERIKRALAKKKALTVKNSKVK